MGDRLGERGTNGGLDERIAQKGDRKCWRSHLVASSPFRTSETMTAGAAAAIARRAERALQAQQTQQRLAEARATAEADEQQKKAQAAQAAARRKSVAAMASVVPCAAQHAKSLKDKKKWRRSAVMDALLPSGAEKVGTFPRREEERFGEEGEEGDRLFEAAMATFKAEDVGDNHCQTRVIKQKFGQLQGSH